MSSMVIFALLAVLTFQFVVILWLVFQKKENGVFTIAKSFNNPERVGAFYNETTDKFLKVYGEVIQAFRTKDVTEYLRYTKDSMELAAGMKIIDAGCGVCGPACYFAKEIPSLKIDALTISEVQVEKSQDKIQERQLKDAINVQLIDFHFMDKYLVPNSYDRVYFLESFGHSNNKDKVIKAAWEVLKPGGKLYIKDLFLRVTESEWEQNRINEIAEQINKAYEYQIGDLNSILTSLRRKGFIINFIRVPNVNREMFENLTISNDFQNLFNIGKIDSWEDYIFPIDFYELLAEKPSYNSLQDLHLFHLNRK